MNDGQIAPPRCHLPLQPGSQLALQDAFVAQEGGVQLDGEELLRAQVDG